MLVLFLVQLLVSFGVVGAVKGYRWFAAFTVTPEAWFGLPCLFLALSALMGDWP